MSRKRVLFISYSHQDHDWAIRILEEFRLRADLQKLDAQIWCDVKDIVPGEDWRQQIRDAIKRARVGLLVVSQHFHKSHFIKNFELHELLEAEKDRRLTLTWLHVGRVEYEMRSYERLQAAVPAEPPLEDLKPAEVQAKLTDAIDNLIKLLQGRHLEPVAGDLLPAARMKSKATAALAFVAILLLGAGWLHQHAYRNVDRTQLLQLLCGRSWISYEPANFHPDYFNSSTSAEIRSELSSIRETGFTGIVTYSSRDDLAQIPRLAHMEGLSVVMGIWNPLDQSELRNAYEAREFVEAYCVGHEGLGEGRYSLDDLERSIIWLKQHTDKPVTTTELSKLYSLESLRLNLVGDFLCPDVHHNSSFSDVAQDISDTLKTIEKMATIANRYDRPLMLKTLTFPVQRDGESDRDLERQAAFYTQVLKSVRDPVGGISVPVAFVPHSAFDAAWKNSGRFLSWDPYTGLFDRSGTPRPAAVQWIALNP